MDKGKVLYMAMVDLCVRRIPGFEVRYKNTNRLQKVIGFILRWVIPFNRRYMTDFTTTLSPYVYFPSEEWVQASYMRAFKVLAHEYVHLWDERAQGSFYYKASYMMPQALGLLPVFALFALLWAPAIWNLLALAFLLPWPSVGRRNIERRGYLMNMAINFWRYSSVTVEQKNWVIGAFTGSGYYFMWPFKGHMERLINQDLNALMDGTLIKGNHGLPFYQVRNLIETSGQAAA